MEVAFTGYIFFAKALIRRMKREQSETVGVLFLRSTHCAFQPTITTQRPLQVVKVMLLLLLLLWFCFFGEEGVD